MKVWLVGIGMGAPGLLTGEARRALESATAIVGSERVLAGLAGFPGERVARAVPERVAAALEEHPEWERVCVALSGDVGFYSGARRLLELLERFEPELVCGVSTPQYFAARLRRPWQNMRLVSAHGVSCDVLAEVLNHPEVLFLTGGETTPADIVGALLDAGLDDALVSVGENLSYPEERITHGAAAELAHAVFADLAAVLVRNERTFARGRAAAGIEDEAFARGGPPMTKREIRAMALSLLRPEGDSVLFDVGAGTGSVSVEMALAARRGRVFAVERDADACRLIDVNRERFGVYNLRTVRGAAPEALAALPPPDGAFIGGSGGRMAEIVAALVDRNPRVRLVASAICLETLSEAVAAMERLDLEPEVCQIAASRAVRRGRKHMLEARNPVFLVGGGLRNG